jgi:hypothetical protein
MVFWYEEKSYAPSRQCARSALFLSHFVCDSRRHITSSLQHIVKCLVSQRGPLVTGQVYCDLWINRKPSAALRV